MIGYIYKISGGNKFYIGSTTQPIKKRLKNHKSKSKEEKRRNIPLYSYFNEIGWNNAIIEIIHQQEFENKIDLLNYEKQLINQYKHDDNCLNKSIPIRTKEEKKENDELYGKNYRLTHKEQEREKLRRWRRDNHDKYLEQARRYRENKLSVV